MSPKPEDIRQKIKKLRKLKQRKARNCADLLKISKKKYKKFEQGEYHLSLPEIELLAFYLDIPLEELFMDKSQDHDDLLMQDQERQDKYKQLRHKMIQAKFIIEQNQSLEKIQELTHIPMEQLESYQKGDSPIPLEHLLQITEVLELTPNAFLNPETLQDKTKKAIPDPQKSPPEFSEERREDHEQGEDPYSHMFNALKRISFEDQADIAKSLLNKLKTK